MLKDKGQVIRLSSFTYFGLIREKCVGDTIFIMDQQDSQRT